MPVAPEELPPVAALVPPELGAAEPPVPADPLELADPPEGDGEELAPVVVVEVVVVEPLVAG